VSAARVIEAVDVFKNGDFNGPASLPGMSPDQFRFDGFEEGFHRRVEAPIFVNTVFPMFLACKDA
jgi:hypothetical protein